MKRIYLYPNSHAGYYPGAQYLAVKILFRQSNQRTLLGAQAVGLDGVDKRDCPGHGRPLGATIYKHVEEAELCYAPQFGSAKSPVDFSRHGGRRMCARRHALCHWKWQQIGRALSRHTPSAPNWRLSRCRARSTFRWNTARASMSCRVTVRFTSSAGQRASPSSSRTRFARNVAAVISARFLIIFILPYKMLTDGRGQVWRRRSMSDAGSNILSGTVPGCLRTG